MCEYCSFFRCRTDKFVPARNYPKNAIISGKEISLGAEYMSAVESGDMEKAERMVRDAVTYDESARRIAEYNVRVWLILSSSP